MYMFILYFPNLMLKLSLTRNLISALDDHGAHVLVGSQGKCPMCPCVKTALSAITLS